jgi:hypothetical protein
LLEPLFDVRIVVMPTPTEPESIAAAADRLAAMEELPRDIRMAGAHVLREAAAGLRRGQPLSWRLHSAVGEFVSAIEALASPRDGGELEFP